MSLVVGALLFAGGAMIGMLAARSLGRRRRSTAGCDERTSYPLDIEHAPGLGVGDVVCVRGEPIWLEGAWMLYEGTRQVGAVLFATDVVLVEAGAPRRSWYAVSAAPLGYGSASLEPPASLEQDGERFERRWRLPVRIEPIGMAPNPPGDAALFAEYHGVSGDCLWMLRSFQAAMAFRGRRLRDGELERWGSGGRPAT